MSLPIATSVAKPFYRHSALTYTVSALLAGNGALAQTSAPPASESLEEVVIVGSHLTQPDQPVAVTVLTQDDMTQRGYATAQQALDGLAQNSGGGIDQQLGIQSFVPAAASVNLRDMGLGRALILLDGHRLPMYPVGFNGTDSFVDISSIPISAIERIEVLTEGASAIYGSDALSGVINIVLKQTPSNEVSLRQSGTTQGGGAQQRWQLSTGSKNDDSSILFTAEYAKQKALWYSQRDISRSDRLGGVSGSGPGSFSAFGYPGTYTNANENNLTPAAGCSPNDYTPVVTSICWFNRASFRQLWPQSDSLSAMARLTQKITDSTEAFVDLLLRNANTDFQYEPQDLDVRYDLGISDISAVVPGTPYGATGSYLRRLIEMGPRTKDFDTHSYTAIGGVKGDLENHWHWEASLQGSRQAVTESDGGLALISDWRAAVNGQRDFDGDGNNDTLNLTQALPDYIAQQLSYTAVSRSSSRLSSAQGSLTGDLLQLQHGPLKMATVIEYVRESYYDARDPELLAGNVVAAGATAGSGHRARSAAGVELQWPVLAALNVNIAGRYDQYNDDSEVGGAFSPRLALSYKPHESVQLRASAGRNFRAPDLQRLFGGDTRSTTTVINTPKCVTDGGSNCTNFIRANVTTHASRDLREEHGMHYSFGTVWKPFAAWSVSVDYFLIDLKDLVQRPAPQYVLDQYAANGSYADWITFNTSAPCQSPAPPSSGCVLLDLYPINIAYKKTSGIDVQLDGKVPTPVGAFSIGITANYLLAVRMKESADRPVVDVLADGQLGEAVRFKGGADLGWELNQWRAHIYVDYIGGFTPLFTNVQEHIGSFTTVNVSGSYALPSKTTVQLGVNNVFNREPPVATYLGNNSAPFYHQQFHNLDGATWFVNLRQGF
jgi:iron complex outermembrane recepter protein